MAQSLLYGLSTGEMFFYLLRGNQYKEAFIYWLSALDVNCYFACSFFRDNGRELERGGAAFSSEIYKNLKQNIPAHIHQ
jgi:hypothetical protein